MILQLLPPVPLDTPAGAGRAFFLIEGGDEADLQWVVFLNASGACWTYRNQEIRLRPNTTMGVRPKFTDEATRGLR